MEDLPPLLEDKRRLLARTLGRPVFIRAIRTPDPRFQGRLRVHPGRVVIEYQIAEHGYFWHIPIIETLLDRAAAGQIAAEIPSPSPDAEEEPPAQ